MAFRCTKPTPHPVKTLAYEPWALTVKPFQVSPRTWYVAGQTWVGCYLIDTGSGLILIDTAIPESMYLLWIPSTGWDINQRTLRKSFSATLILITAGRPGP